MSCAEKTKQLSLAIEYLDTKVARKLILEDDIKPTGLTDEQYNKFFKLAVESRDTPLVSKLLEVRPKLDGTLGAQLLWKVIDDDDTEIAMMLVRASADVNQSFNRHLLQVLAKSNDRRKLGLALLMMKHATDAMAKDAYGSTACDFTIKHGNLAFVWELLRQGVEFEDDLVKPIESKRLYINVDYVQDGTTRSELMAKTFTILCRIKIDDGYVLDMVKVLLDREIPPFIAILDAVRREKFNVVKLLLDRTDIDQSIKMMFLQGAVSLARTTMARLLIEWGADIEYQDSERGNNMGMRPLHFACLYRSQQNIQLLLHLGADVNAVDHIDMTPFARLTLNGLLGAQHTKTCRLVVKHFALLNSKGAVVNEHDLALIKFHPVLKKFFDECLAELQVMKEDRIISGFPFYSIFTRSIQDLSLLTRRQIFTEGYKNHLNFFPIYRSDLNMRIREAGRRKKLLMPKEDAIYESLREILSDIPIEKIIQYLYLSEVETLKDRIMMLDSECNESCT